MEANNKVQFGRLLKKCRKLANITQENLALAIELEGGSSISHYENGEDIPKQEKLELIIEILKEKGVPTTLTNELYTYSGYTQQRFSNPLTERVNNIFEGPHKETKWLLEWVLNEILEPIDKYQIALTNMRRGENPEAQIVFDKLLPATANPFLYKERLRLKLLVSSADARRLQGDFTSAVGMLKDAEIIAKNLGENGLDELASILKLRGNIYRRLSSWKDAKEDFNSAIQAFRDYEFCCNVKQDTALAKLERKLAGTHLFQGQPKEAIKHIDRSITICDEQSDAYGKIQGLQHRAWALGLLGYLDDALKIHKDILRALDTSKTHPISIAKGYRYLGDSYRMCGIPKKALEAYTKAIEYLDNFFTGKAEDKDVLVYGTINLGIGASYRALMDHHNAAKHLEQSLKLHMTMGAKYYEALTRRELGKMMLETDISVAEIEFTKAKELFAELDNIYYLIGLSRDFADLEYRRGNFPKARAYATKAINQSHENGFTARQVMAQITLAKINLVNPDKLIPFELYSLALHAAVDLDPYLVHEALCNITDQPSILDSESALKPETKRLCQLILNGKSKQIALRTFPEKSINSWLAELDQLETQLDNEIHSKEFSNGRAVIVGISAYQNMRPLEKTIIDAQDLNDLLIRSGYSSSNISLLLDNKATKKNINKAMDDLARNAQPTDTVLFFFSGHGERHVGGFELGEYICPVEADRDDLNKTAISNEELTTAIKSIPAKQVVVFLDACHSGGVGEPKNSDSGIKAGLSENTYEKLATGEGRVVIASCKPNEYSWELPEMENGLFSHYLLEGLDGNAADTEGAVRIFQLFKYVSENVPRHKSQQHPLMKMTTDRDFPVIKIS
jgi:tetratricopeptide (TPR) repeat protein